MLYGSLGSLVVGLGHFLATSKYLFLLFLIYLFARKKSGFINNGKSSKVFSLIFLRIFVFLSGRVRRSCDFAVGGFICTMLGYWYVKRFLNFDLGWLLCTT